MSTDEVELEQALRRPALRPPRRRCGSAPPPSWPTCGAPGRRAPTRTAPSATRSPACTSSGSPSCEAVEDRLCFGRLDLRDGRPALHRPARALRRRADPAAGRLAGAGGRSRSTRPPPRAPAASCAAGTSPPAAARSPASTTRCSTSTRSTETERSTLHRRGRAARRPRRAAAPAGWATSSPPSRPSRTGSSAPTLAGVLVVQGGPGTGKTAVALHRAAYLLYTHRERLAPQRRAARRARTPLFLRYIEQVLPSLGETGVRAGHRRRALPRRRRRRRTSRAPRSPRSRATCGWPRCSPRRCATGSGCPDGAVRARRRRRTRSTLTRATSRGARARARAQPARRTTRPATASCGLLDVLAEQARRARIGTGARPTTTASRPASTTCATPATYAGSSTWRWMPLTPERLLRDLFADPARLAAAAPDLTAAERALLRRDRAARRGRRPTCRCSTRLAELLGDDDRRRPGGRGGGRAAERAEERRLRRRRRCATSAAAMPADRRAARRPVRRDAARRSRSPSGPPADRELGVRPRRRRRGAGAVADDVAAADAPLPDPVDDRGRRRRPDRVGRRRASWAEVLDPYVAGPLAAGRADRQLPHAGAGHGASPPTCSRRPASTRPPPSRCARAMDAGRRTRSRRGDDAAGAPTPSAPSWSCLGEGRLAVAHRPRRGRRAARPRWPPALPEGTVGAGADTAGPAGRRCSPSPRPRGWSSTPSSLVEPGDILAGSARGANDLYVALTRPTQRLRVLHSDPLPPGLTDLATA